MALLVFLVRYRAFAYNVVLHLCGGLTGRALFMPLNQVLLGCVNLSMFLCRIGDFAIRITTDVAAIWLGILTMGLLLAMHFGRLYGANLAQRR